MKVARVCLPAAYGYCTCGKVVEAIYTIADLPEAHPAQKDPQIRKNIGICFILVEYNETGESTGCELACKECAFQYDEEHGYWRPREE